MRVPLNNRFSPYGCRGRDMSSRSMKTRTRNSAKLDGDQAIFKCVACGKKTTWAGYTADAFSAPLGRVFKPQSEANRVS